VLTDDNEDPHSQPTRKNLLDAMRWLVENAQPDDALFFHCKWTETPSVLNADVMPTLISLQIRDTVEGPVTWMAMRWMDTMMVK
jgi:hypothetical protein